MQITYAYAVVHREPPTVYVAENLEVLNEVIGREVIAQTPSVRFRPDALAGIRSALADRQWGKALELWILHTGVAVDVFESEDVWTAQRLEMTPYELALIRSPLYRESDA